MEEELQKRNTDCVYFLASPLTCKKGAECEYRHSEMARLNPRDCWFWLAGTCLNPTCAFRHPPLEKPAEASSESGPAPSQPPQPSSKSSVPCYFYFQGYCGKNEKCPFSHAPDASTIPTVKTLKPAPPSNNSDVHPTNNNDKTLSGTKTASVPTPKTQNNLPVTTPQNPSDSKDVQKSSSLQIGAPLGDPAGVLESSDTVLPSESYNEARSYMGAADQNSEDHIDDRVEPEERWESSPGFDVLVDNDEEEGDQNLCYEDEEYMVPLNREEQRELDSNHQFVEYELEERRVEYERRMGFRESREVDLREHLRKRRAIDDGVPAFERSTRRRHRDESLPRRHRSRERPYEHGLSERLRGRLASEVGRTDNNYGIMSRHSPYERPPRQHHRERRGVPRRLPPFIPSERAFVPMEVRRKPVRRERSVEVSGEFSGPKSLAQIREEKRRVGERNGYYNEDRDDDDDDMGVTESANFDGPKPLNEILKEKKKLSSFVEYNNGSSN